jgi:hypothetical protein
MRLTGWVITGGLLAALAATPAMGGEIARDRREVRQDRREIREDNRDIARIGVSWPATAASWRATSAPADTTR